MHLLGRPAEGPLSRPFKSAQQRMLEDMGAGQAAEDGTADEDDDPGVVVVDDDEDDEDEGAIEE